MAQASLRAPPDVAFAMHSWPLLLPSFSLSSSLFFSLFSLSVLNLQHNFTNFGLKQLSVKMLGKSEVCVYFYETVLTKYRTGHQQLGGHWAVCRLAGYVHVGTFCGFLDTVGTIPYHTHTLLPYPYMWLKTMHGGKNNEM